MRSKWMQVNGQPHGNRCCMPPRSGEAFQWGPLGRRFVNVIRLGIKLRCEPLDIFARDNFFLALKTHANSKIVEPFDHGLSPSWICYITLTAQGKVTPAKGRLPCTLRSAKARQKPEWPKS